MGLLDGLKQALKGVQDLQSGLTAVRKQLEAAQREREDIASAPACRADVKAAYSRWIDGCSAEYSGILQRHVAALVHKPQAFDESKSSKASTALANLAVLSVSRADTTPTPRGIDVGLMALLGKSIKPEIFRIIDGLEWPSAEGLPMDQRSQKLTELDRRIDKLLTEEAELVQFAAANRIILD